MLNKFYYFSIHVQCTKDIVQLTKEIRKNQVDLRIYAIFGVQQPPCKNQHRLWACLFTSVQEMVIIIIINRGE